MPCTIQRGGTKGAHVNTACPVERQWQHTRCQGTTAHQMLADAGPAALIDGAHASNTQPGSAFLKPLYKHNKRNATRWEPMRAQGSAKARAQFFRQAASCTMTRAVSLLKQAAPHHHTQASFFQ